jgi:hypothetical protein
MNSTWNASWPAVALVLMLLTASAGCSSGETPEAVEPVEVVPAAPTPSDTSPPSGAPSSDMPGGAAEERLKFVVPLRGEAKIGYLAPDIKRANNMVVTKFTLKNLSNAPIVGLRIDEFWYDKAGNTLPSDSQRVRQPIEPGAVVTVELQTPYNASMDRNSYRFSHANGTVDATQLKSLSQ